MKNTSFFPGTDTAINLFKDFRINQLVQQQSRLGIQRLFLRYFTQNLAFIVRDFNRNPWKSDSHAWNVLSFRADGNCASLLWSNAVSDCWRHCSRSSDLTACYQHLQQQNLEETRQRKLEFSKMLQWSVNQDVADYLFTFSMFLAFFLPQTSASCLVVMFLPDPVPWYRFLRLPPLDLLPEMSF